MKKIFIEAVSNVRIRLNKAQIAKLAKLGRVGLMTTVQHLEQLKEVSKQLPGSVVGGQVLGCNASNAIKISPKVDLFLFIGTGRFHPIEIAKKTGKDVYVYNPMSKKLAELDKNDILAIEKIRTRGMIKFHSSDVIGVIVSTKDGQKPKFNLNKLEKKYPKKKFYEFVTNTIDYNELENFNFIQAWVNTACPRIIEDYERIPKGIVNLEDVI